MNIPEPSIVVRDGDARKTWSLAHLKALPEKQVDENGVGFDSPEETQISVNYQKRENGYWMSNTHISAAI